MTGGRIDLAARAVATGKTVAKYQERAFDWNGASCIHLARFHARAMGHRVPKMPRITSAVGARRALRDTGFADTAALLDSLFPRIAPARMLVGDLAILPGENDAGERDDWLAAVVLADGLGNVLGWHGMADGLTAIKFTMADFVGAWRM